MSAATTFIQLLEDDAIDAFRHHSIGADPGRGRIGSYDASRRNTPLEPSGWARGEVNALKHDPSWAKLAGAINRKTQAFPWQVYLTYADPFTSNEFSYAWANNDVTRDRLRYRGRLVFDHEKQDLQRFNVPIMATFQEVYEANGITPQQAANAINVMFLGNWGTDAVPISNWKKSGNVLHRIGHIFDAASGGRIDELHPMESIKLAIEEFRGHILRGLPKLPDDDKNMAAMFFSQRQLEHPAEPAVYAALFPEFPSSRSKSLRVRELPHELSALFMKQGEIKLDLSRIEGMVDMAEVTKSDEWRLKAGLSPDIQHAVKWINHALHELWASAVGCYFVI